jgi:aryl-alcohol dehydrogenase-like predicted oxidoreductase
MPSDSPRMLTSRRSLLRSLVAVGVGGRALLRTGDARAAVYAARDAAGSPADWPTIPRRSLGRTGFEAGRLVFGCGAALSRGPKDDLLAAAFDAGINVFDVGFRGYYSDAEENLAPFLKSVRNGSKTRDQIFLISKAMPAREIEPGEEVSVAQARDIATKWLELMDDSLRELQVDHVDAYYVMAANNTSLIGSEEIHGAFEKAKQAGKVKHLGLSTHQNAQRVLETAIGTGWYDLATLAVTPAGWYDWADKRILEDSKPMVGLQPLLDRARESGMGLVGMKAGRYLAGRKFLGWGKPDAFDDYYNEPLLKSKLSSFQRSYAFVLAHGLDAVNADMQSFAHLQENVAAAAASTTTRYFA